MGSPVTVEHRAAPRVPASSVPAITGIRLSPIGADATLVNISATGVLVECGRRVQIGSAVTVQFQGTFSPASAEGRVARCAVATVGRTGDLRYHVGIAFKNPIVVAAPGDQDAAGVQQAPIPPAAPAPRPRGMVRNRW
jgi:hypothetical protein